VIRTSLVIVLVEDERHRMLIRRFLLQSGFGNHQVRISQSPSGSGSAENWVRKEFVKETAAYRNRQARAQSALIVMIDADRLTVRDRLNQLDQAVQANGAPVVAPGEQIARLVPKRNVETWILCLNRHAADEVTDYKRSREDWSEIIPDAARSLHEWTRPSAYSSLLR
jgi:hypothetical protein